MKFAKKNLLILILLLCSSIIFLLQNSFAAKDKDGNIIIKSLLVNPSSTQSQKIPFKAYLPREIRPEHIIDAADLEIDFDYQKSQYFAYKEYELKPSEQKTIEIVLKDIWKIPEEEINAFKERSRQLLEGFEGSDFYDQASQYKSNIDKTLKEIEESMRRGDPVNPSEQMKQYREIMEMLSSIQNNMVEADRIRGEKNNAQPKIPGNIIITIIVSLFLLSAIFFILWYLKMKPGGDGDSNINIITQVKPAPMPEGIKKEVKKDDKKTGINDLENILNKKA